MKIFAYALRPYDELGYLDALSRELGFEYDWTADYPTLENAGLAAGADGVCIITNPMTPDLLAAYRELDVRGLATRSIGYDHIDLLAARELGIRVAHAAYPPEGVANYAIMLMLMALRKIKLVMRCAAAQDFSLAGKIGRDHIDLLAARELGIRVAHAAYPPEGVANYAIMLMLMALRKIKLVMRCAAAQDFSLAGKIGRDLSSCTVGVVGTGAIGACVIRHLQGFGCRVLACDPVKRDELRALATYVSLPELLAASDVVTLHAPGLPENHHMIGGTELALMRQGAVLVNAARGSLVDTGALVEALESGRLGGAALDTIEHEEGLCYLDRSRDALPNRDRAVLSALPNVIVSPHMAFYTDEDVAGMVRSNVEALLAFADGGETPYEVR